MSSTQDNFKRGTAEMLILHMLFEEDKYGYQITQELCTKSGGTYKILEGTLYTILFKMSEEGYISDYIKQVGKKRTRRYYHLEEAGRLAYIQLLNDYDIIAKSISSILDRESMARDYDKIIKIRNKEIC